jgi:hypothetical protein
MRGCIGGHKVRLFKHNNVAILSHLLCDIWKIEQFIFSCLYLSKSLNELN